MSTTDVRGAANTPDLSRRDLTLDLARVVCVLLVVLIHLLQTGVGPGPDGGLTASRPLEQQPWFAAATWAGQIMPLFFVVGGFASAAGWRSWARKGGTASGYVRLRTLRLAQPTLPLFVFFAIVLGAATLLALAPALVSAAALGAGSPLWFLAAYLLCQAATPWLLAFHGRMPRLTVAVLLVGVVIVDAARFSSGATDVGLVNLVFVWLLVHQLGFWYADGWFDRRHPLTLLGIAAACYLSLWPLTSIGPYSDNMLAGLNPPTLPLVVLGLAQACLLRLARTPLSRLMQTRVMRAIVFVVGSRLMTVYLWHLPVILLVTGLTLLVPGAAPVPASAAWWWSRPVVLVAVLALLYALSLLVARWEAVGDLAPAPRAAIVAVGFALAFLPAFAVMRLGLSLPLAVGGAIALALAVWLLRRGGAPARR
ncbi:acyltransferase [Microbacterium sp. SORGH_AS_0888]|uniref:acyltransferase family protein n=1 Tax=Microbacterium sp. SORGH_AS_0888 TaxID=3041791 RepID=UPI0027844B79|nr:acyltransferase [Microbacterium sp. SORGH_AS_0888]MDQ1131076.1 fucose 4-O-acetylase-like acetyltransferase [Microbacterium sp. SORGH_AS_0888]